MFALYGASRESFSGAYDAWTTRLHPDDRAVTEAALQDAVSGKKTYTRDFRVIWANGEVHHIKGHAHVVTDKDGNPIHMLGTNWDNSAFAQTHQKLLLARSAINNSKSIFIWHTPDGQVADVNDFACSSLGYTLNELISLHICDFDSEMTAESWPDIWKQLKKSGENHYQTFYRHKDGTVFPVEIINNYIAVNGQELCFSFINDITERKEIKKKLRDANAFSVGILDSLTAHIAVLDEQGVIIAVNRAWIQFSKANNLSEFSYDMLGANYLDVCKNAINQASGEEAKLAVAGIKAVLAGESKTFKLKYHCHSPDQQRWFQMNVFRLQGSRRGVVVSHENITDRKLAQLKLQDKEQMLSESQRITHIGSWSFDLATGYISWSDEMYHLYGVTEETFDHTLAGFISIIHPDDRAAMQQWCNNCLTGDAPEELDFRVVWPDGTIRLIRGSGGLQYDDMNKPFRGVGSAQDITERKERDQRDKEHLDQLAHISRLGLMGDMAVGAD
jgi:PAS domain S-box-containing protein